MIGLVAAGRPLRTDFIASAPDKLFIDVPEPRAVATLCAFLLPSASLPANAGLAFFWALPPYSDFAALGVLTAAAPSAVWATGWPATPEVAAAPSVRVCVSLLPADAIASLAAGRAAEAEARAAGFAQSLAADAGNFLGSFAQVLPGVGERLVLPPSALSVWLKRVEERFRADPEFFRSRR